MQLSPRLEYHSFNICNFLISCSISIIAPFFPIFANSNGLGFTLIGVIFSMQPLGGFFGSLYLGSILTEKNRINMIIWSVLIQSGCMALFALQYFLPDYYFIVITGFLARIINGIAYSALICAFYSYIPKLFPDDVESHIALAETASSLGFMFGPFIGSMLFSLGGYTVPFIVLSILSILCAGFIRFYISPKAIIIPVEYELQTLSDNIVENQKQIQITYLEAINIYNFTIHVLVVIMCTILFTFPFPILAEYLLTEYLIDSGSIGLYVFLCPMAYMCVSVVLIYMKNIPKQKMIFIGLIVNSLSQFFLGPDKMFTGLDKSILTFCFASIIQGMAAAFPFIFSLPQMTEALIEKYPNRVDDCTNISSAAFSASYSLGEFIGPLLSGILHMYFQFDRIASLFGILTILVCIAYIPLLLKGKYL